MLVVNGVPVRSSAKISLEMIAIDVVGDIKTLAKKDGTYIKTFAKKDGTYTRPSMYSIFSYKFQCIVLFSPRQNTTIPHALRSKILLFEDPAVEPKKQLF